MTNPAGAAIVNAIGPIRQLVRSEDKIRRRSPAAGVGGFVLEPPLIVPPLVNNTTFAKGQPKRRIRFIGDLVILPGTPDNHGAAVQVQRDEGILTQHDDMICCSA
jgi:hypothetical protein